MENPDFVFESAGNKHLKSSVRARNRRKSQADVGALRRREVDILNYERLGAGIQVNHGNGLLGFVSLLTELNAVPAVHHQEITAFAVASKSVRAAKHRYGHGSDGG